jgi:hypothetical protein
LVRLCGCGRTRPAPHMAKGWGGKTKKAFHVAISRLF